MENRGQVNAGRIMTEQDLQRDVDRKIKKVDEILKETDQELRRIEQFLLRQKLLEERYKFLVEMKRSLEMERMR